VSALDDFKAARDALVAERAALLKRVEEIDAALGLPVRRPYGGNVEAIRSFLAANPGASHGAIIRHVGPTSSGAISLLLKRGEVRRVDGRHYLNRTAEAAQ